MNPVRLREFDNSWYKPGRSVFWQAAWFFFGSPLLKSYLIPSSFFRVQLLRLFGAKVADGVTLKPGVRVKYPWKLEIGSDTWIGEDAWIDNLAPVRLGNNVCVSQGVYFCTGNHNWSDPAFGLIVQPIELEDGAWAGAKSVLVPGVRLGECAVAAAGSVVTKSIPAYEVHCGNPAACVKSRKISAGDRTDVLHVHNTCVHTFDRDIKESVAL